MSDDSRPVDDPPPPDRVVAFIWGVISMLVATGMLFGLMLSFTSRQDGVDVRDRIPLVVGLCLGCGLLGGVRSMILARHTRRLRRMGIGALFGALIGAVVGAGFVPVLRGFGPPSPLMTAWCALAFSLCLALRAIFDDA